MFEGAKLSPLLNYGLCVCQYYVKTTKFKYNIIRHIFFPFSNERKLPKMKRAKVRDWGPVTPDPEIRGASETLAGYIFIIFCLIDKNQYAQSKPHCDISLL